MICTLHRHPESPCKSVSRLDVEVLRLEGSQLLLRYRLEGRIEQIALPPEEAPNRKDGLWRHTCFEMFLRRADGYCEFNFSPSTAWAAYAFDGYREGMRPLAIDAPSIAEHRTKNELRLDVITTIPESQGALQLALTAVIEEADGTISYWALNNAPGKPDFHHPDGFALELP
jgi:hypothetical protein